MDREQSRVRGADPAHLTPPGEQDSRSAAEIQRDISRRLALLDRRTDVLEERLRPQRIFDELWKELRSDDGYLSVSAAVRRHPVPVLLIACGLAWFLIERVTGRSVRGNGRSVAGNGRSEVDVLPAPTRDTTFATGVGPDLA